MLWKTCVHITHVCGVHSPVLVLAMHFLFGSVFAMAYQLPVEGELQGWA
jgi:hypothetical protein